MLLCTLTKLQRRFYKVITFGAKYISPINIEKFNRKGEPLTYRASFVELLPDKKTDFISLSLLLGKKQYNTEYLHNIFDDFSNAIAGDAGGDTGTRFFAITKPQKQYSFIFPFKILGIADISNSYFDLNTVFVRYIEAFPGIFANKLNHIGSALLDGLKNIYPQKDIAGNGLPKLVPFYKHNGFEIEDTICDGELIRVKYNPTLK